MKLSSLFIAGSLLILVSSCSSSKKLAGTGSTRISHLEFVNEYVVPNDFIFKGIVVGGLSSIDYDAKNNLYYMVCDDRSDKSAARFYTATIHITENGIDTVNFTDAISWKDKNGNTYPSRAVDSFHTPDPESMRYDAARNQLVWSSEGERIVNARKTLLEDPSIYITDLNGQFKDSFALPSNMHMSVTQKGPRQNSVFEGTTFSDDHKYLFVSVEEPLYEDGPRAGTGDSTAWVRVIRFDANTKQQVAQYAYQLSPIAHPANPPGSFRVNGISEILYAGNDQLLILERSFSSGREGNTIRVFQADMKNATDISGITSIPGQPGIKPLTKKLLLNMDDLGRYIDNVEGLTFGPVLADGSRSIIFISDNNFDEKEKTQFLLFRIIP